MYKLGLRPLFPVEYRRDDELEAWLDAGVDTIRYGPVTAFVNYQRDRFSPMNILKAHPTGRVLHWLLF